MYNAVFFGGLDVTALVLTVFVGFFFALILYLRREDRREGYPLEDDLTGRLEPTSGMFFTAKPKTFVLPYELGVVTTQTGARDAPVLKATRTSVVSGSPLEPVGDPLLAGVGPGSFAQRAKRVETMGHGQARIVPLRAAPGYSIDKADGKLIGLTVVGADGLPAGVVSDLWVDRMEFLVRYIEVELSPTLPQPGLTVVGSAPPARRVLAPMTMSVISRSTGTVQVEAILASQFAGVPTLGREDEITLDEEERVTAYFGGGYLYATPARAEPLI